MILSFGFSHVGTGSLVENFRAPGVGLEKGEGRNFEFQAQQLLVKMVTAIDNLGSFVFDRISHTVVVGVKDSHNCAGQFQRQHPGYPVHIRKIQLAGGYQINENITGLTPFLTSRCRRYP